MNKRVIPSEQIGSIPRAPELINAYKLFKDNKLSYDELCDIAESETLKVMKD